MEGSQWSSNLDSDRKKAAPSYERAVFFCSYISIERKILREGFNNPKTQSVKHQNIRKL